MLREKKKEERISRNLDVVRPIHRGGGGTSDDSHYYKDGLTEGQSEVETYEGSKECCLLGQNPACEFSG